MKRLALIFVAMLLASPVHAKPTGNTGRTAIQKSFKARGWSTKGLRVHYLGRSKSGLSKHYAAGVRSGKVRLTTVRSGHVTVGARTGFVTQTQARSKANLHLRRERNGKHPAGTFSGVNNATRRSGMSRSGKSYRFNSATDRTEGAAVTYRKPGKVRRWDLKPSLKQYVPKIIK
uniref:Uncharacterized protein n=1 Tax=viral metagenome TaxID=1070528 RepID=A0A6H2A0D6_9ZZZZ